MFVVVLLNVLFLGIIADTSHNIVQQCGNFKPQQWVEVDKMLGKWFVTEVIFHGSEESRAVDYHEQCPIIFLSEILQDGLLAKSDTLEADSYNNQEYKPNTQDEPIHWDELMEPLVKVWQDISTSKHRKDGRRTTTVASAENLDQFKKQSLVRLRLLWAERGTKIEYSLRYNESVAGYWMSFGSQNGSAYAQHGYKQFLGTIQVMKAVRTHTVLTFCHISDRHQFFTVVISREPWSTQADLDHILSMLRRKNLPVYHVRKTCLEYRNLTALNKSTTLLIVLLIAASIFL